MRALILPFLLCIYCLQPGFAQQTSTTKKRKLLFSVSLETAFGKLYLKPGWYYSHGFHYLDAKARGSQFGGSISLMNDAERMGFDFGIYYSAMTFTYKQTDWPENHDRAGFLRVLPGFTGFRKLGKVNLHGAAHLSIDIPMETDYRLGFGLQPTLGLGIKALVVYASYNLGFTSILKTEHDLGANVDGYPMMFRFGLKFFPQFLK